MRQWLLVARANTLMRWTLAIAGGFSAMALLLFAFIYWQTAAHEQARVDAIILRAYQNVGGVAPAEVAAALDAWLAADTHEVRYAGLFDAGGAHISGNLPAPPSDLARDGHPHRSQFGVIGRDGDGDDPEVVRGIATRLGDGRLLVIGYDLDELEEVNDIIVRALSLGLAPMLLLSLLGGLLLTWRAQRRIGEIHKAVAHIRQGRLRQRLPVRGSGDDLDKVSEAVNEMLDDIERLVDEIRGVGDNIAHDLRTPLTRVRGKLERSREEARTRAEFQRACDQAMESLDQALAVVGAVLRVTEIEHGRRRSLFEPVDLAALCRETAELYGPLAEERGIHIDVDAAIPAHALGDRDLLLEALGNLIDNAVKFAPPNSRIALSLHRRGGAACLRLVDRGPGIPASERDRVFQRFYRMDKSRTVRGSGLGLSLVAAAMTLHGFGLRLDDAGPGCLVEITCPLMPAEIEVSRPRGRAA